MRFFTAFLFLFFSFNIYLSAQSDWHPITPPGAPTARQGHSMVTLPDGRVLLFGGEGGQGLFNDLYAYENSSWTELTPDNTPPPARRDHQAWARGDEMYVYGGYGENGALDDIWSYNTTTNSWQQIQITGNKPSARQGHATATLADGTVIMVGGTDADGNPLDEVWKLNVDNSFTQLGDFPRPISDANVELVADNQLAVVFGIPNLVGMYQFSSGIWSLISDGPPLSGSANTTQGKNADGDVVIYIFGGKDSNGNENSTVYVYNLNTGQTTIRGAMPQPLVNAASTNINAVPQGLSKINSIASTNSFESTLFVFGGISNGTPTNAAYTFSTQTPPDTVTVIAVPDTIRADSVTFTWHSAAPIKATYYGIELVRDTTTTPDTIKATTTDTTYTVNNLAAMKDYFWHIRAYNAGGWGNYNKYQKFYTDFVTGIEVTDQSIPKDFELIQNYPNPFNPSTIISYSIPEFSQVTLKVFDLLGREVLTLVNQEQKAGSYNVTLNALGFASGMYFYRLSTDKGFVLTKKMVLLR